jgi:hypothetical protein
MDNFDASKPSTGFGDSIAKVTNFFGIDKLADAVAKLAGAEGCGCKERREYLNHLFPYDKSIRQVRFVRDIVIDGTTYLEGNTVLVGKNSPLYPRILTLAQEGTIVEV